MNRTSIVAQLLSLVAIPGLLMGNPSGEQTIQGECTFERSADALTIHQQSDRAIVEWQDFSIAQGETTRILQLKELSKRKMGLPV